MQNIDFMTELMKQFNFGVYENEDDSDSSFDEETCVEEGMAAVSEPTQREQEEVSMQTEECQTTASESTSGRFEIDRKKLILYSEIMKPKFDEGLK